MKCEAKPVQVTKLLVKVGPLWWQKHRSTHEARGHVAKGRQYSLLVGKIVSYFRFTFSVIFFYNENVIFKSIL